MHWWESGQAQLAHAADTAEHGPLLVTHGGLTHSLWLLLDEPTSPVEAANAINSWVGSHPERAFADGRMLTGYGDGVAGVAWADPALELYTGWMTHADRGGKVPFAQVHGHASAWQWSSGSWRRSTPDQVRQARTRADSERRHAHFSIGDRSFIGIDPGHGRWPAPRWAPLALHLT